MSDTPTSSNDQAKARQARLRDALRANLKKRRAQIRGRAAAEGEADDAGTSGPDDAAADPMMTNGDQR